MAPTATATLQDSLHSQYLSRSLSGLSGSRSTNSLIVRLYKQATQLYLTKRFKEALETLEPIVSAPPPPPPPAADDADDAERAAAPPAGLAPIAHSSRGTRTKVWVFYLSLLHSIVEMGLEEGKRVFGTTAWRQMAARVRDGSIWEEVVQRGYGGREGDVDADVVVNLATLLLGHMQSQRPNQQRLEAYLAAAASEGADFGGGGGGGGNLSFAADGISTPMSNSSASPRSLATRLKILELYTLHVLPANEEWQYSRSFIEMNDVLDEERKEAFLAALQNLEDEQAGAAMREKALKAQREREMERQWKEESEAAARQAAEVKEEEQRRIAEAERQTASTTSLPPPKTTTTNGTASNPSRPPPKTNKKAAPPSPSPPNLYRRASAVFTNVHQLVLRAGRNMNFTSVALLRFLTFVVAILLVLARRDLRLKIRRTLEAGWGKVRQTVGMGVKVSYI